MDSPTHTQMLAMLKVAKDEPYGDYRRVDVAQAMTIVRHYRSAIGTMIALLEAK